MVVSDRQIGKHLYVSYLCLLKGPRSNNTPGALNMPGILIWAGTGKKQDEPGICYCAKSKKYLKNEGDV